MDLTDREVVLARIACEKWAAEIRADLGSAKAIGFSSIARQDMNDTERELRVIVAKLT
jgi:hypothetical protein